MKNLLIVSVVILLLVIGGYLVVRGNQPSDTKETSEKQSTPSPTTQQEETVKSEVTVTFNGTEFTPPVVGVKTGGKVTYVNRGTAQIQIASNPHPAHTDNPEISGGQSVLVLNPGESKTVTVTKVGIFVYHNHLTPDQQGLIGVEQ